MTGHVTSAKAPDRLSSSKSFLHVESNNQTEKATRCSFILEEYYQNIVVRLHTCHHGLGLPILHHETWHSMDLLERGKKKGPVSNRNLVTKVQK